MNEELISILKACTVEGNNVKLPAGQLPRPLYDQVAKALNNIGGKWKGGKVMAFQFPHDPTELLEEISGGVKRNLKKEFQFFATPDALCDEMVEDADIRIGTKRICEPSAGDGAIIKAILRKVQFQVFIEYCELMPTNQTILQKLAHTRKAGDISFIQPDFMKMASKNQYDRIIANPPFTKNQDIDQIYQMYRLVKPGGRIVTLASTHYKNCNNKKETEFRNWLDAIDARVTDIPAGTFKESGTNIATVKIIIDKPE